MNAVTLYDADNAILSGDFTRAHAVLDELLAYFPENSVDAGECAVRKALLFEREGRADEALTWLRRTGAIPGMPTEVTRRVAFERIRILDGRDGRAAREAAKSWLMDFPKGEDAAKVRWLLSERLRKDGDVRAALGVLNDRPADERKRPYDTPLAEMEKRLRTLIAAKDKPASRDTANEAKLAAARALLDTDPRKAATSLNRLVDDPSAGGSVRLAALTAKAEALDALGDLAGLAETAKALASRSATGMDPVVLAEARSVAAGILLDTTDGAAAALAAARDALAWAKPDSETAEDARWVAARALCRLKHPASEIAEILRDSPAIAKSAHARDSPKHPVNRLISAGGDPAKWIAENLGQVAPAGLTRALRAADECFAAKRYADAAKRYALAETRGSPSLDIRAYAALQRARSLAQAERPAEALAQYRRFAADKTLARSAYAAGAFRRAGSLAEGTLSDVKGARDLFRTGYARYPETEDGQACLIYLAESHVDSGEVKTAERLYEDYLKRFPEGHHAGAARNFLNNLRSRKK